MANDPQLLLRTLRGEPGLPVPHFEWLVDPRVEAALRPGADHDAFLEREGIDAACVDLDYAVEDLGGGLLRDGWGIVKRRGGELHPVPVDGPVKSRADLDRYVPPDPADPARYRSLERALERHGDHRAVVLHLNDALSLPSRLMRFDEFMLATLTEPDLVADLVDLTVAVNLAMAAEARRRGAEIVYTGDDYAYGAGPLVSPELFRELLLPRIRRVVAGYHALGLLVIKHTDGDIRPILDDLVDAGFDALDPIDPMGGLDLAAVKRAHGARLTLKGNVDCAGLLSFGTPAEVRAASLRCLAVGAPGGRYVFSSSNSIHSAVRPENYRAMLDAWRDWNAGPAAEAFVMAPPSSIERSLWGRRGESLSPVFLGGHDYLCAALGEGVVGAGELLDVVGTWELVVAPTPRPRLEREVFRSGLTVESSAVAGTWATTGCAVAGGVADWYRRELLGAGASWGELDRRARTAPPGSRGALFLPHLEGAGSPHGDPDPLGALAGLSPACEVERRGREVAPDPRLAAPASAARWRALYPALKDLNRSIREGSV